ncbi:DUF1989 domain-containing protein [Paenibacillus sp. IHBB 10380]|uniref:DUF1989 domain-containing protein n=1 Tax=Paenibacillus sp. IHBB 10380 TaxID=1566358 RepID=UPI0005CFA82D|nr:urea carboxylase-associated family protein [Paenibacillus sp. IHBB 10380]AJS58714.1 hypothetical protein UB51_09715 [Paenibacillus sp. IHBB 10380]
MTEEHIVQTIDIPALEGRGFRIKQGEIVKVIDVEGQQVADFVAIVASNTTERLDPTVTMDVLRSVHVKPNDVLYSNVYRPLLTIIEDKVGRHDFINSACRPEMYGFLYHQPEHASCYHNLNVSLAEFGIQQPPQHYPFNLFMNTVIDSQGNIQVKAPISTAGDYISLRAEMDLIIAISACPCQESDCNGTHCTPIRVEIIST